MAEGTIEVMLHLAVCSGTMKCMCRRLGVQIWHAR